MKNLLRYYPGLSAALGSGVFVWREDEYLPGLGGGSKVRMFEEFDWTGIERVYTTGIVQSNQVRQLTAFCKDRYPHVRVEAAVCPDGDEEVNYDLERIRGSLRYAVNNGTSVVCYQASKRAAFNDQVAEYQALAETDHKALFIPRGVGCRAGTEAWIKVGEFLAQQFGAMRRTLPIRTDLWHVPTFLVVSGSGSTHLGLHVGLEGLVGARVIGLSTKRSSSEQNDMLVKRMAVEFGRDVDPIVNACYATPDGQFTDKSRAATAFWRPFVDFDTCPIYNDRLFQWISDHPLRRNPLVLINTGNNCFSDV